MIGRLQRVPLREVWKHEAHDFTQWLEQNIDVLNDVLDFTLINVEREKKTESTFSVDLVAESEDGATVIIENQLEKSNHDHLGKLITYLTAMQAKAAIWIVSEPRPEHVAAIAWLNEAAGADFYLLKIEAVRIETSPPAPLLTMIVGPSEEAKSVGQTKQEMDERHHLRQRWWSELVRHPDAKLHQHITPSTTTWIGRASGTPGVGFNYSATKDTASAEVYIDRGKGRGEENLAIFDQLYARKDDIERAFGEPLGWERMEGKQGCRIRASVDGGYGFPEEHWPEIHRRMAATMNRLVEAMKPQLQNLHMNGLAYALAPADIETGI